MLLLILSASDVPESPVPERQRLWRARVLGQVQQSRGERTTFIEPSYENFAGSIGADVCLRRPRGRIAATTLISLSPCADTFFCTT